MTGQEAVEYIKVYTQRFPELSPLWSICNEVLSTEAFAIGYGSKVGSDHAHHAYLGGLAVHTLEVLEIAYSMAKDSKYLNPNIDVLIVAAICHDYRKISEYDMGGTPTEYKKLLCHVAGSYADFMDWSFEHGLEDDMRLQIGHCLLAHHGRYEWGSPVLPQTVEANILHYADMLSMQFGKGRFLNV